MITIIEFSRPSFVMIIMISLQNVIAIVMESICKYIISQFIYFMIENFNQRNVRVRSYHFRGLKRNCFNIFIVGKEWKFCIFNYDDR